MTTSRDSSPDENPHKIQELTVDDQLRQRHRGDGATLLEIMAADRPLPQLLNALCRFAETIAETTGGLRCGIYLLDRSDQKIGAFAAPRVPISFSRALCALPLHPDAGPCARAACLKVQVIATDLELDPLWQASDFRALAAEHSLRSCWSTPIFSSSRQVLGNLAMLHDQPAEPSPAQLDLMWKITNIASMMIDAVWNEAAPPALPADLVQTKETMRLAASLSRNMLQPLSGIAINASTCLRILSSDNPDMVSARETMRRTLRDCTRASNMIAGLLSLLSMTEAVANIT